MGGVDYNPRGTTLGPIHPDESLDHIPCVFSSPPSWRWSEEATTRPQEHTDTATRSFRVLQCSQPPRRTNDTTSPTTPHDDDPGHVPPLRPCVLCQAPHPARPRPPLLRFFAALRSDVRPLDFAHQAASRPPSRRISPTRPLLQRFNLRPTTGKLSTLRSQTAIFPASVWLILVKSEHEQSRPHHVPLTSPCKTPLPPQLAPPGGVSVGGYRDSCGSRRFRRRSERVFAGGRAGR